MEPNTEELKAKIGGSFENAINSEGKERDEYAIELLQSVVDLIDLADEGNIWHRYKSIVLPPNETTFPYGTGINFIPVSGSTSAEWKAMITFSRGEKDTRVGGSVFIEGTKGPDGNKLNKLSYAESELNTKQILLGVGAIGFSMLSEIEER